MRKQQQIWHKEHLEAQGFPSYVKPEPSGMVVMFLDYLKSTGVPLRGNLVDIGCGKGRNSIYTAEEGFEVFAVDYIKEALDYAEKQSKNINGIHFLRAAIDEPWPFEDNFFDIAIDCFSSIDIETKEGREMYKTEMFRTLKPGGLAMVAVVSAEDEFEREVILKNPGLEPNSALWENGKFQKDYSEEELCEFYKEFKIEKLELIQKPAEKMGRKFLASNYFVILKK